MYATCLYCHSHLGRNDRLPRFPVGRRIAFDSARGRLWVVCRSCARWNLSPLEERWAAFDECERLFRATRVRISTDNIGLVELPDGMSLIRIGQPLWPEFAAWRYARRFRSRRVKTSIAAGAILGSAAGIALGAVALGFGGLAFAGAYAAGLWVADEGPKRRPAAAFRVHHRLVRLTQEDAEATRVLQHRYEVTFDGFALLQYRSGTDGQAFHRDTDMRYLEDTIVAIVSFGATRPWLLRPKTAKHTDAPGRGATHDLQPGSGDLLVMGGRCQADWEHSVPYLGRESTVGPRISIQWRHAKPVGRPFQGSSYRAPLHYGRDR